MILSSKSCSSVHSSFTLALLTLLLTLCTVDKCTDFLINTRSQLLLSFRFKLLQLLLITNLLFVWKWFALQFTIWSKEIDVKPLHLKQKNDALKVYYRDGGLPLIPFNLRIEHLMVLMDLFINVYLLFVAILLTINKCNADLNYVVIRWSTWRLLRPVLHTGLIHSVYVISIH